MVFTLAMEKNVFSFHFVYFFLKNWSEQSSKSKRDYPLTKNFFKNKIEFEH